MKRSPQACLFYLYIFLFYFFVLFLNWRLQGQERTELNQWKWCWSVSKILYWVLGQHVDTEWKQERNLCITIRRTCAYLNKKKKKGSLGGVGTIAFMAFFPYICTFQDSMGMTYLLSVNVHCSQHLLHWNSCIIKLL